MIASPITSLLGTDPFVRLVSSSRLGSVGDHAYRHAYCLSSTQFQSRQENHIWQKEGSRCAEVVRTSHYQILSILDIWGIIGSKQTTTHRCLQSFISPVIAFHRGRSGIYSPGFWPSVLDNCRYILWCLLLGLFSVVNLPFRRGGINSLAHRRTSVRDSVFRGPMVFSSGNPSRSTNLSVVVELNCSCSTNSQSTSGFRYNPDTVGPFPSTILLASARLVHLFIFKVASISALYCPHALGCGRFQRSPLVDSTPSAGTVVADELSAGAEIVAGKLLALVMGPAHHVIA